jgi:hypothetical protein
MVFAGTVLRLKHAYFLFSVQNPIGIPSKKPMPEMCTPGLELMDMLHLKNRKSG